MSDLNMGIWDQVCKTDPEKTKRVKQRGGYTAIDSQYQMQEATKVFGSYGKGWGFKSIDFDYGILDVSGLVLVKAVFFYVVSDKEYTFPINNAWEIKNGAKYDADFAKKAETNTMSKALSKLGFSADVYMGDFDKAEYVNKQLEEVKQKTIIESEEKEAKEAKKLAEESEIAINQMGEAKTFEEAEKIYKPIFRKVYRVGNKTLQIQLKSVFESVKQKFEGDSND